MKQADLFQPFEKYYLVQFFGNVFVFFVFCLKIEYGWIHF